MTAPARLRRNRLFLVLVLALFITPLVLAWLLIGKWQPIGSAAHGELLSPAQPVPAWQGQNLAAEVVDETLLRGRWSMVYLSAGPVCDSVCETSLYNMRQLNIALGKDSNRAETLLFFSAQPTEEFLAWLTREHPAMLKIVLEDSTLPNFIANAFGDEAPEQSIYLVDPLGNLFMHYDPSVNPSDILKDFRRLLKYSKIG